LGRTVPFPSSASSNARCMKILGFMVSNLDQFLSFLAITGSPCPIRKVKPKYSDYPLFHH
jgi:hypothetical protein